MGLRPNWYQIGNRTCQGLFQQFIARDNCTQSAALFKNIFKFYTIWSKFSNILVIVARFNIFFVLFSALLLKNRTHALTFQNRPSMLYTKSQQVLHRKRISMLTSLKVSSFACKYVFYISEHNSKRGLHKTEF